MSDDALMRWETEGGALGVANRRQSATARATPCDQADPRHAEPENWDSPVPARFAPTKTPLGSNGRGGPVHQEPTSDSAFALAASALALAMLTLFAVLVLADVVGLTQMLPFFVLPPALLVASGFFLWRWATGEAEASAAQEIVHAQHEKGRQ